MTSGTRCAQLFFRPFAWSQTGEFSFEDEEFGPHWHMNAQDFHHYRLLLDERGEQILVRTDDIAEEARRIGGTTFRSNSGLSKHQRLNNSDEEIRCAGGVNL
jgi:hypothetical protein